MVYPSALTEDIDVHGVGRDRIFIDAYVGHISESTTESGDCAFSPSPGLTDVSVAMINRWTPQRPFPDPFEYLQEPPPVYEKDCPCHCRSPRADCELGDTKQAGRED